VCVCVLYFVWVVLDFILNEGYERHSSSIISGDGLNPKWLLFGSNSDVNMVMAHYGSDVNMVMAHYGHRVKIKTTGHSLNIL